MAFLDEIGGFFNNLFSGNNASSSGANRRQTGELQKAVNNGTLGSSNSQFRMGNLNNRNGNVFNNNDDQRRQQEEAARQEAERKKREEERRKAEEARKAREASEQRAKQELERQNTQQADKLNVNKAFSSGGLTRNSFARKPQQSQTAFGKPTISHGIQNKKQDMASRIKASQEAVIRDQEKSKQLERVRDEELSGLSLQDVSRQIGSSYKNKDSSQAMNQFMKAVGSVNSKGATDFSFNGLLKAYENSSGDQQADLREGIRKAQAIATVDGNAEAADMLGRIGSIFAEGGRYGAKQKNQSLTRQINSVGSNAGFVGDMAQPINTLVGKAFGISGNNEVEDRYQKQDAIRNIEMSDTGAAGAVNNALGFVGNTGLALGTGGVYNLAQAGVGAANTADNIIRNNNKILDYDESDNPVIRGMNTNEKIGEGISTGINAALAIAGKAGKGPTLNGFKAADIAKYAKSEIPFALGTTGAELAADALSGEEITAEKVSKDLLWNLAQDIGMDIYGAKRAGGYDGRTDQGRSNKGVIDDVRRGANEAFETVKQADSPIQGIKDVTRDVVSQEGPMGREYTQFNDGSRSQEAADYINRRQQGVAREAVESSDNIRYDLPYGRSNSDEQKGYGLSHIRNDHVGGMDNVYNTLRAIESGAPASRQPWDTRTRYEVGNQRAVTADNYLGNDQYKPIITGYQKTGDAGTNPTDTARPVSVGDEPRSIAPTDIDSIPKNAANVNVENNAELRNIKSNVDSDVEVVSEAPNGGQVVRETTPEGASREYIVNPSADEAAQAQAQRQSYVASKTNEDLIKEINDGIIDNKSVREISDDFKPTSERYEVPYATGREYYGDVEVLTDFQARTLNVSSNPLAQAARHDNIDISTVGARNKLVNDILTDKVSLGEEIDSYIKRRYTEARANSVEPIKPAEAIKPAESTIDTKIPVVEPEKPVETQNRVVAESEDTFSDGFIPTKGRINNVPLEGKNMLTKGDLYKMTKVGPDDYIGNEINGHREHIKVAKNGKQFISWEQQTDSGKWIPETRAAYMWGTQYKGIDAANYDRLVQDTLMESRRSGQTVDMVAVRNDKDTGTSVRPIEGNYTIDGGFVRDPNTGAIIGNHVEVTPFGVFQNIGGKVVNAETYAGDLVDWGSKGGITKTLDRIIEQNAPSKEVGDQMFEYLVANKRNAEARMKTEMADLKTNYSKQADEVMKSKPGGMSKDEYKTDIFRYGEGKFTIGDTGGKQMNQLEMLQTKYGPEVAGKIDEFSRYTRGMYDAMLDDVNGVFRRFGMDEVPKRQDYMTHLQEQSFWDRMGLTEEMVANLLPGIQGESAGQVRGTLPGNIAGLTEDFKPNKKWNQFFQRRRGSDSATDPFKAMEAYIDATLYNKYMTEPTLRARSMETAFRAAEEVTNQGNNAIRELPTEISKIFDQKYSGNRHGKFVNQLQEYANALAGKSSAIDRPWIDKVPGLVKTSRALQSIAGRSSIVGNVQSSLAQAMNLPNTIGTTGVRNTAKGIARSLGDLVGGKVLNKELPYKQSDFLTARYTDATGKYSKSGFQKFSDKVSAATLMPQIEEAFVKIAWNSSYENALSKGLKGREAVQAADRMTERVVGGRGIGDTPEIYRSTLGKTFLQYTLEVNSSFKNVTKDMNVKQMATFVAATYLLNSAMEELTGRRPLPDMVQAGIDTFEDVTDEDKSVGEKVTSAIQNIGSEAVGAHPVASSLSNLMPQQARKAVFGTDSDLGRYDGAPAIAGLVGNALTAGMSAVEGDFENAATQGLSFVPFGAQIRKTTQGVNKNIEQGIGGFDAVKNALFGKNATTTDYDGLTEKQQGIIKGLVSSNSSETNGELMNSVTREDYLSAIKRQKDNKDNENYKDSNDARWDNKIINLADGSYIQNGEWYAVNKDGKIRRDDGVTSAYTGDVRGLNQDQINLLAMTQSEVERDAEGDKWDTQGAYYDAKIAALQTKLAATQEGYNAGSNSKQDIEAIENDIQKTKDLGTISGINHIAKSDAEYGQILSSAGINSVYELGKLYDSTGVTAWRKLANSNPALYEALGIYDASRSGAGVSGKSGDKNSNKYYYTGSSSGSKSKKKSSGGSGGSKRQAFPSLPSLSLLYRDTSAPNYSESTNKGKGIVKGITNPNINTTAEVKNLPRVAIK